MFHSISQFRDTDCKFQTISKLNWSKSNMNQLLLCTLQITTECCNAILPWLWLFHRTEWNSYASPHWSICLKTVDHWLDRAQQALHAGTLGTGILVARRIGSDIQNNYIGRSLPIAITRTLTFTFLQCGYQHVGHVEFYPVIHSLWWSDTYIAVHIFPLFCSILWNSLSLRLEFCNDWSCYKGWEICLGHSPSISLHSTTCQ